LNAFAQQSTIPVEPRYRKVSDGRFPVECGIKIPFFARERPLFAACANGLRGSRNEVSEHRTKAGSPDLARFPFRAPRLITKGSFADKAVARPDA
jgi:hypothetical protein